MPGTLYYRKLFFLGGGGGATLNTKVKQKSFIGEIGLGNLCIIQESWYIL